MDSSQWPLGIGVVKATELSPGPVLERKARPQNDQALNCPRCNSTNTKFCYYNNYSLSQPRYLCKTCKRYWTHGGTLRNIPVGGSSRKNKRQSSSSEASSKKLDLTPPTSFLQQSPNTHEGQDFNLANQSTGHQDSYDYMPKFVHVPFSITNSNNSIQSQNHSVSSQHLSAMQPLKTAGTGRATTPSFMVMPGSDSHTLYSSGFPAQEEFKHSLNFCLDEYGVGFGNLPRMQETSGNCRISFPVEELKAVPSMKDYEQNRGQGDSSEVWNGMLNGGSW